MPALLALEAGTRLAEIDPRLEPRVSEPVLNKLFASAFYGTGLPSLRRDGHPDSNRCLDERLRPGHRRRHPPLRLPRLVVPREAVGDRNPDAHEANLYDIDAKYGDVVGVEDALDYLWEISAGR